MACLIEPVIGLLHVILVHVILVPVILVPEILVPVIPVNIILLEKSVFVSGLYCNAVVELVVSEYKDCAEPTALVDKTG